MTKNKQIPGLPSKEILRQFIQESPDALNKRDIARAFGIKGQDRMLLRRLLRELAEEGMVQKDGGKSYKAPDALPDTTMIEITGMDGDGELRAKPVEWFGKGVEPIIFVTDKKKTGAGLKPGDQVLAKLKRIAKNEYEARVLKSLDEAAGSAERVIGVFKPYKDGGYVYPTNKKIKEDFFVPPAYVEGLGEGDLVMAEKIPPSAKIPKSKNPVRIVERLGKKDDPRLISLIAIHSHGIPVEFPKDVLSESEGLTEPDLSGGREDMRSIPLVTIDGADARDFDDAVFAEPDKDPKNPGGWHLVVAIADVSYYVRPGSKLDREAYKRGNSTYFADRVVPMLPERLSNDLCSLRPLVNRACLAVHMIIDKDARLITYRFARGLMRSAARLTYEQVEDAHKGSLDDLTAPLIDTVIKPLYKAYSLLKRAREKRGALELELPERKAIIKDGVVAAIVPRQRLESHQLIEEFMILANVAAAEELERKNAPCIYRIHDKPSFERTEATREFLKEAGYSLAKTEDIHPKSLNFILKASSERGDAPLIHVMLLRMQSQAIYHPENVGHFGLALEKYAHFTSPIRRYADLIVHRSLVAAGKLGDGGLPAEEGDTIYDISEHISQTERRSMLAERDVMDRFTAQYLSSHVGSDFKGRVSSVQSFGLFVSLDDSGADGIVPMRQLPRDYYIYDEKRHSLTGKQFGRSYRLSDPVVVRVLEADPMRGSTVFEILDGGVDQPEEGRRPFSNRGSSGHRKSKNRGNRDRNGAGRPGPSKDRGGKKKSGGKKRRK